MKEVKQKLTLDQPATYQIKVPGHLDESWSEWAGGMTITVENGDDGPPITTLTGIVADLIATNRSLLEDALTRIKKIELDRPAEKNIPTSK